MPRELKPLKVGQVSCANGALADVMLDRNNNKFFVEIVPGDRDTRVYAGSVEEVKRLARPELLKRDKYDWRQVIVVDFAAPYDVRNARGHENASGFVLKFYRFEASPDPLDDKGAWVKRRSLIDLQESFNEGIPEHILKSREENTQREVYRRKDEGQYEFPYDQALWDRLHELREAIEAMALAIEVLVGSKNSAAILSGAVPLLEPPKP